MSAWLISVAGISLLTIICDLLLAEGNTKKYVRAVIGVVVSLVMIAPVITFFSNFSIDVLERSNQIEAQQQYLDSVQAKKLQSQKQQIISVLDEFDIKNYTLEMASDNSFVLGLTCNKSTYKKISQAMAGITKNISITWSDSDG